VLSFICEKHCKFFFNFFGWGSFSSSSGITWILNSLGAKGMKVDQGKLVGLQYFCVLI
jgi:hypothetical protein